MDEELVDCPPASNFRLPKDLQYLIGHNIDFDWQAVGQPDVKRICTLALARKVWPEADAFEERAAIREYCGGQDRAAAERAAYGEVTAC